MPWIICSVKSTKHQCKSCFQVKPGDRSQEWFFFSLPMVESFLRIDGGHAFFVTLCPWRINHFFHVHWIVRSTKVKDTLSYWLPLCDVCHWGQKIRISSSRPGNKPCPPFTGKVISSNDKGLTRKFQWFTWGEIEDSHAGGEQAWQWLARRVTPCDTRRESEETFKKLYIVLGRKSTWEKKNTSSAEERGTPKE